jgi:Thoeris protein ThsB, TIR-like domain
MARKVFYSFQFKPDNWRASQVRQMGVIEGNAPVSDNDWEKVTGGGEEAIKNWIAGQMLGKSCAIVLIGTNTTGRKWINHEIVKAWDDKKGVLGIYIHALKDNDQKQSTRGGNPFDHITLGTNGPKLSTVVKTYDPPYSDSTQAYAYIKQNLSDWVEAAIKIRDAH